MQRTKLFFKGLKTGMREFSHGLATSVNFILLSIVFILGIGLVSIVSKIKGKKFLKERNDNENTFWEKTNVGGKKSKEEYLKPF